MAEISSGEFISVYSDDQGFLERLCDPSAPTEASLTPAVTRACLSRFWAHVIVGAVECMVREWAAKPGLRDIYAYLNRQSNERKVELLRRAFQMRGIDVDVNAFEDFLAIKYIRNAYVHCGWDESQRAFVQSRGFPGSLLHLEEEHTNRMRVSYYKVMECLGRANMLDTAIELNKRSRSQSPGVPT